MSWVKIDDRAPTHTKFLMAGFEAWGWWAAALAYCNRELTDGFIASRSVPLVFSTAPVDRALEMVEILVREHLLHPVASGQHPRCSHPQCRRFKSRSEGYFLHDYFDYQPTKNHVLNLARMKAAAGRKGGEAKAKRWRQSAKQGAEHAAESLVCPRPVPSRPVPIGTNEVGTSFVSEPPEPSPKHDKHELRRLVDQHASRFAERTGRPMVIVYARDCRRVKPIVDAHGIDAALALDRAFFDTADAWWVRKRAWNLGAFVSAVNDLVAGNTNGHHPRPLTIAEKWAGQPSGKVTL